MSISPFPTLDEFIDWCAREDYQPRGGPLHELHVTECAAIFVVEGWPDATDDDQAEVIAWLVTEWMTPSCT